MRTLELNGARVAGLVEESIGLIACTLRPDVYSALEEAKSQAQGRCAAVLEQLTQNALIAREDHTPICQDTGTVWLCLEIGEESGISLPANLLSQLDSAVARAYKGNALRMSLLKDALIDRSNSGDNTPAFCHIDFVPGCGAKLHVMLKGGGSDNASQVLMLPPGAGVEGIGEALIHRIQQKASSACPPLIIGMGIGATFDTVAHLAKKALLRPVGAFSDKPQVAALEAELLARVNQLGIGPAALGGAPTALHLSIETAPCHIAALPVAIQMGCSAMRSLSIDLVATRDMDCKTAVAASFEEMGR